MMIFITRNVNRFVQSRHVLAMQHSTRDFSKVFAGILLTLFLLASAACGQGNNQSSRPTPTSCGSVQKSSPTSVKTTSVCLTVSTDTSSDFLKGNPQGALVAKAAPTIDFGVPDITPYGTNYGTWANVVEHDGTFYFSFGHSPSSSHGQNGALLASYAPGSKTMKVLVSSKNTAFPGLNSENKWHGRAAFDTDGNTYLTGFYQGHILHYNANTNTAEDLGAPVSGKSWAESIYDGARHRLYAVGDNNTATSEQKDAPLGDILVYDTQHKKVVSQDLPVDASTGKSFHWNSRARLLDPATGDLYGTADDAGNHLARYNPANNTFTLLKSQLSSPVRAWTNQADTDKDGRFFWMFDDKGDIYKFYPEQDKVKSEGKNWGQSGWYVTSLERSSDGHYLYYGLSQANLSPDTVGQPILQYDTKTNHIKVVAFLSNFYLTKYHYQTTKIYGVALSQDGTSLFVISNGNKVNGSKKPVINPSMFTIHIPDSER